MIDAETATAGADAVAALYVRVGEVVNGFFLYYATEFDWETNVATISCVAITPKSEMAARWGTENEGGTKALCIEDPYEACNLGKDGLAADHVRGQMCLAAMQLSKGMGSSVFEV